MKKIFLPIILIFLLAIIFVPILAKAVGQGGGIVTCDGPDCTIDKFFEMLGKIYNFIVLDIAAPLATIAVAVGGILMMISAGNPNLMSKGKTVFWSGVIGLVLALCSYLIVNFIMTSIGAKGLSG